MNTDKKEFTDWQEFDPIEYSQRNYWEMLTEDEVIIRLFDKMMNKLWIKESSFEEAADIWARPNLYPAMLLLPLVKNKITLLEYSQANRDYVSKILSGEANWDYKWHKENWVNYNKRISSMLWSRYRMTLKEIWSRVEIKEWDIYNLPNETYPAISSFFCSESITTSKEEFLKAIRSLLSSLKPGWVFVIAHMVWSEWYPAWHWTSFPAINLSISDLEETYSSIEEIESYKVEDTNAWDDKLKAREWYHSMALVMWKKKRK